MKTRTVITIGICFITWQFAWSADDTANKTSKPKITVTTEKDNSIKLEAIFSSAEDFEKVKREMAQPISPGVIASGCDEYCVTCTNPSSEKFGHKESVCTGGWFVGPLLQGRPHLRSRI